MPTMEHLFVGSYELKSRLSELLRRMGEGFLCVHITLRGRPVAALVSEPVSDLRRTGAGTAPSLYAMDCLRQEIRDLHAKCAEAGLRAAAASLHCAHEDIGRAIVNRWTRKAIEVPDKKAKPHV